MEDVIVELDRELAQYDFSMEVETQGTSCCREDDGNDDDEHKKVEQSGGPMGKHGREPPLGKYTCDHAGKPPMGRSHSPTYTEYNSR